MAKKIQKKDSKLITWFTIALSVIGIIALVIMTLRVLGII